MHILTWPIIKYVAISFEKKNDVLFSSLWVILLNKLWTVKAFFSSKATYDKDNFDLSAVMCIFTKRRASDTLFCQPAYSSPSYQRWKLRWGPSEGSPVESHKRRTGSSIKGHLFCLNFSRNTTRSLLRPDPSFGWTALLKGRFLPWAQSCSLASIHLAPFWISGS